MPSASDTPTTPPVASPVDSWTAVHFAAGILLGAVGVPAASVAAVALSVTLAETALAAVLPLAPRTHPCHPARQLCDAASLVFGHFITTRKAPAEPELADQEADA
jgi:hypothetical protein